MADVDSPESMWTQCSVVLDAPVSKWGFELDDFIFLAVTLIVLPLGGSFFLDLDIWDAVKILGFWLGLVAIVYFGKRGKPAGFLFHWLHAMQFFLPARWGRLPGFLPPAPQIYSPF